MIRKGQPRDPRSYPAASSVGDLATHQAGPRVVTPTCRHRWWEAPLAWLFVGVALAIALIPIAFVAWIVVEQCT